MFKALRQKDIKVNGVRTKTDINVFENDYIEVYIADSLLIPIPEIKIIFEDENLIVINKPQGLKVHPDSEKNVYSLIEMLKDRYGEKVNLCHRLDRNTGGLIIAAKNEYALDIISEKIRKNEIKKIYRARVFGRLKNREAVLTAYLDKDSRDSRVYINDEPKLGATEIKTKYSVLSYDPATKTSLLDIELLTGKTHQIRAHLAYIGHPIIGDGKYGTNELNKSIKNSIYQYKYQALIAYKLFFAFESASGQMEYLKNTVVEIEPNFR
jgi:23S rRNA pseudouridine955/2504/2580 synthase